VCKGLLCSRAHPQSEIEVDPRRQVSLVQFRLPLLPVLAKPESRPDVLMLWERERVAPWCDRNGSWKLPGALAGSTLMGGTLGRANGVDDGDRAPVDRERSKTSVQTRG
jgi:hypothetical protein